MHIKRIILKVAIAALIGCGGGGGDASYAGRWQVSLSPDPSYESASPRCLKNAQPIEEVITIEQTGGSVVVRFETGDVLMDAGGSFAGRIDSNEVIAGQTNALMNCPRGYRAEIVQTLVFACPAGDVCNDVRRVLVNECPRTDYNGRNDEIRDSPGCISTWNGRAVKMVEE